MAIVIIMTTLILTQYSVVRFFPTITPYCVFLGYYPGANFSYLKSFVDRDIKVPREVLNSDLLGQSILQILAAFPVIPAAVILAFMSRAFWNAKKLMISVSGGRKAKQQRTQTAFKAIIAMSIVFIMCNTPAVVTCTMRLIRRFQLLQLEKLDDIRTMHKVLNPTWTDRYYVRVVTEIIFTVGNSCINPFVLLLCKPRLQKVLAKHAKRLVRRKKFLETLKITTISTRPPQATVVVHNKWACTTFAAEENYNDDTFPDPHQV